MFHCCAIVELLNLFNLRLVDLFKRIEKKVSAVVLDREHEHSARYFKSKELYLTTFFICI